MDSLRPSMRRNSQGGNIHRAGRPIEANAFPVPGSSFREAEDATANAVQFECASCRTRTFLPSPGGLEPRHPTKRAWRLGQAKQKCADDAVIRQMEESHPAGIRATRLRPRESDVLLGFGVSFAMPIKPRCPRGRHLYDATNFRIDIQAQMIAREDAAGYVMQMNHGTSAVVRKSAYHFPGRLLLLHVHAGAALPRVEAQDKSSR